MKCKQIDKLLIVNEWQQETCPNCKHYCEGKCLNPDRLEANDPCPLDQIELKIKDFNKD